MDPRERGGSLWWWWWLYTGVAGHLCSKRLSSLLWQPTRMKRFVHTFYIRERLSYLPQWVGCLVRPSLSTVLCLLTLKSVRRPQDVIYFLKAMTNSFHFQSVFLRGIPGLRIFYALWICSKSHQTTGFMLINDQGPTLTASSGSDECLFFPRSTLGSGSW